LTLRHCDTINAAAGGTFIKRRPEECYDLIENMTAHHNDLDTSAQRSESSSSITSSSDTEVATLKAEMAEINKNLMKGASHGQNPPPAYQAPAYQALVYQAPVHQPQIPQPQLVTTNEFTNFMKANDAILKNTQTNMTSLTNSNLELKNMFDFVDQQDKLSELPRTPLNEHCSAVLLKKFLEKLGDPDKFLIPCDSPEMAECLALSDLGASINLMPLSGYRRCLRQSGNIFLADFVVVDFDADPRVPLILGRYFLKTRRDLIDVFEGGTFIKRRPKECYDLIENMTAHHKDWDTSAQRSESSSSITSSFDTEIEALKAKMAEINKNLMRVLQVNQQVKAFTLNCETCGGPHSFSDCPATVSNTQNVYAAGAYQGNSYQPQGNRNLLSYRSDNYLGPPGKTQFFQGANQGQNQPPAYKAPVYQAPVHQPQIPQPQVVTTNEFTSFMKANDAILKNMQTNMTSLTNSNLELKNMFGQFMKMNTASSSGLRTLPGNTITNPKEDLKGITTRIGTAYPGPIIPTTSSSPVVELSAPRPNQRPSIPYPSILQDQKLRGKANDQREKFFQIFKDINFNISFADALILMPKFGPSIKSLLTNKDKLCELARTPLNEHCSAVILKKLPKKLGDPGKFLIPCDFLGMAECLALFDLGALINLMPLSVWNKLSLPDLSPTCMTIELADRSISHPVGVADDVFVKVGTFHVSANFVVVDFDVDPRVPLILERSFLKTRRALIDVFEGELTLRVGKEAITFNLDQTSRYSANYNDMTENRIDVIDMACEEYSQEVLGFSDVIASGNPTPYYDPIVSTTSPTLTPFGNSDFLLEEVDAFLALEDDPTSSEVNQSYLDSEGDNLLLESFLNDDPSLPSPNQGHYLPEVRKKLKICEAKSDKSSIDEPSEVEIKDLPPHLEYAFLEGNDKFSVIIVKDLSIEEKTALITDFEPAVEHQRRVNPKIHDVIKQEVLKLLDAGLIYPISDSPWVSPVHCVPKKGGFTVVENEENGLILTRLVTGWRVCIDYRKLNEATCKDHFPLPFMDQMLERLAGNQYYYFLDGFSGPVHCVPKKGGFTVVENEENGLILTRLVTGWRVCIDYPGNQYYYFLDGFSGYFQIPIDPKDQEKTTFTCPYGTFAYRRMPFGL
nr:reverse transcriptase domain-containing protein [Tanacetum cinerariifolium]